jgi:hypothetical protein
MPLTPQWSVGMQKLDAGVYFERDCIHFDLDEICAANNLDPNPRIARWWATKWLLDWLEFQHRPQTLFDLR